jgi:hypothetical protein
MWRKAPNPDKSITITLPAVVLLEKLTVQVVELDEQPSFTVLWI